MEPTRSHRTSPSRLAGSRLGAAGRAIITLLALLGLGGIAVWAQPASGFRLEPTRATLGQEVELIGSDLPANARFELRLRGPAGFDASETITTDDDGALRYTLEPTAAGAWTLRLTGPADAPGESPQEAFLGLVVAAATDAATTAPGLGEDAATEEAAAQDTAAEEAAAQDAATEDAAAQDAVPEDAATQDAGPAADESDAATPATEGEPDAVEEPAAAPAPAAPAETPADAGAGPQGPAPAEEAPGAAAPSPDTPDLPVDADASAPIEHRLDGSDLVAERSGEELWRLPFPAGSGPSSALLIEQDALTLGHGLGLLRIDPEQGLVTSRALLPAPATAIERSASGELTLTVTYPDGPSEVRRVEDAGGDLNVVDTVRFGAALEPFLWLQQEASGPDPTARLERDPTNPWLHLGAGRAAAEAGDAEAAQAHYRSAVERAESFFDLASLGQELWTLGEEVLAGEAVDRALRDFAARDYTPELLTDPQLIVAYGFPLAQLQGALASDDRAAADFWAQWTYRSVAPPTPGARSALRDYAELLAADGEGDAASLWRARASELRQRRVSALLDGIAAQVGAVGWLGLGGLLLAALLLQLTLAAKYWRPQSLVLERSRLDGRRPGRGARLFVARYATVTEKLVAVLLLACVLALAGLVRWNDRAAATPPAAGSGTLTSTPVQEFLDSALLDTPEAALARGYAAQVSGDEALAERSYDAAGELPAALNNLAALRGDEALYQRALERSPGLREARYNLGRSTSPNAFHERYRPGQPMLVPPTPLDLRTALAGSWESAIATAFTNPWGSFDEAPGWLPGWIWLLLLVLFALTVVLSVLWLFAPRPRAARNAPRGWPYQLLALLVPGSGLADELWGLLLLVPWALLGVDALLQLQGFPSRLGLGLRADTIALAAIYAVNLVAWLIELVSYTRRMRELRKRDPELARRYGMLRS